MILNRDKKALNSVFMQQNHTPQWLLYPTPPTHSNVTILEPTTFDDQRPQQNQRTRTNEDCKRVLEEVYEKTTTPSAKVRDNLADRLQMTPRSIQIW